MFPIPNHLPLLYLRIMFPLMTYLIVASSQDLLLSQMMFTVTRHISSYLVNPLVSAPLTCVLSCKLINRGCLTTTIDLLTIDVCCISEVRTEVSGHTIQLVAFKISSEYFLCASEGNEALGAEHLNVGIVLNDKAEASL